MCLHVFVCLRARGKERDRVQDRGGERGRGRGIDIVGERGRGGYVEQYPTSSGSIRQPCSAITQYENGAMRSRAKERKQRETRAREGVKKKSLRDLLG